MESLVTWYQRKIGAYDLQIWERAVEIQEQRDGRVEPKEKKTSSVRRDLIDVDLVRGSTFSKNKPHYSWITVTFQGLIRVLFLPYFYKWWIQQSSKWATMLFCLLYCLHILISMLYMSGTNEDFKYVPASEVVMPFVFMAILGNIHCHVVATHFRPYTRVDGRRIHQKRTLSSALLEPLTSSSQQATLSFVSSSVKRPRSSTEVSKDPDCAVGDESLPEGPHILIGRPNRSSSLDVGKKDSTTAGDSSHEKSVHPETSMWEMQQASRNSTESAKCDGDFVDSEHRTITNVDSRRVRSDLFWEDSSGSDESSLVENSCSENDGEVCIDAKKGGSNDDDDDTSQVSATALLPYASPGHDRVVVKIWESSQCKKFQVSLLDIGGIIRKKVQESPLQSDSFAVMLCFACLVAYLPTLFRIAFHFTSIRQNYEGASFGALMPDCVTVVYDVALFVKEVFSSAYGQDLSLLEIFLIQAVVVERFICSFVLLLMLVTALRTFRQRLLFAKYFSHLTSARRARKSEIPHFRLDKVENVRFWLSLRSFLRRRGPQRSVDVIVSSAFFLSLCLLCFISVQLLHDTNLFLSSLVHWEMMVWLLAIAIFLLNFLTLGAQINRKYSNVSILLTEQINLYLRMNERPHKKEELQKVNGVLSIAAKLIKEIERPFNIYGLAMNPLLYNITRVVVLSAFSGVISEVLGFKLKIWKIKS